MKILPVALRQKLIDFARDTFCSANIERPATPLPPLNQPVSIHMVLSSSAVWMGLQAARSLEFHSGRTWPWFFHDDGSLSEADAERIQRLFPQARVIRRREADAAMDTALANHPVSRENRKKHNWFLKFFDTWHYAPHPRYVVLDSDIVFFRKPEFILRWIQTPDAGLWFMKDTKEAYAAPRAELEKIMGFPFRPLVNSGCCLMDKAAYSLDQAEKYLREVGPIATQFQFFEQSLFAMTGSAWGKGGHLGAEYEISWGNFRHPRSVMRHYVATFKNDLLYVEGSTVFYFQRLLAKQPRTKQ